MTGTILNIVTVLIGGGAGLLFGARLPDRIRESSIWAIALFVIALGVKMTLQSQNALISIGSVLLGGLLGEWWRIDATIERAGGWLEARTTRKATAEGTARFIKGFVSASLLFCVGPMAILGAIDDGLRGNIQILAVKSLLDGVTSVAFAASLGEGVLFAAVPVLLYQGSISLLAAQAQAVLTTPMTSELTAAGGLLMMGIGVSMLGLRPIRVANYLPALAIAPLIAAILHLVGVAGF
jgi:uncharacterized membrane protein YqgA involved in biofilm formation